MAKQVGPVFITGTIDGIIFYKLGDTYYLRSKGDYKSAKRMRKDPGLQRTMANAERFGVAAKMVKRVYYRQLPGTVRKPGLFARLTGMVNKWLYQGKTKEEAQELLLAHCQKLAAKPTTIEATPSVRTTAPVLPPLFTSAPATTEKKKEITRTTPRVKQARYLSKWKVKRNGRLHIPTPDSNVVQSGPEFVDGLNPPVTGHHRKRMNV
ncbi:hypothetical protein [Flavisolibacter tropicus]|uniref:Uncharacterized protein n=1 Tax=Flavisolibacter tropicus TaxID=1492898 RepID=A0A172TYI2_9BACT|nr:hypothetical protein [Flavisolibacter tropicus]ANE52161.1 hypothetical protein SY85_18345 [Flavisolibacter tropicus]